MKKSFFAVLAVLILLFSATAQALQVNFKVNASGIHAGINAGVSVGGGNEYFTAIGRYQGVADKDVLFIQKRGIPDEQIPVVMFIASRANVRPEVIMDLRRQGRSWADIALNFGLGADAFYVQVDGPVYGRVYGRLYSYFNRPLNMWNQIRLSDDDIVNFVNLRFMSDHYGYRPDEVIRMRETGKSYITINREYYMDKDRRAHGWRDKNNVWHDRAANFKPADRNWNQRDNYWKMNDNRWHGNGDKAWQQQQKEKNYNDNKRWHGKVKEEDFNDNRVQGNRQDKNFRDSGSKEKRDNGKNYNNKDNSRQDRKAYGKDDNKSNGKGGNKRGKNGNGNGQAAQEPTQAPAQDDNGNKQNSKRGHDNGNGNDNQNNGKGNMK